MSNFIFNAISKMVDEEKSLIISAIMEKIPSHLTEGDRSIAVRDVIEAMIIVVEEVLGYHQKNNETQP
jgi:hypothetical protein